MNPPGRGAATVRGLATLGTIATSMGLASAAPAATVSRWGSYIPGAAELQTAPTPANLSGVTEIDASNSSSYALKKDGSVWAWGDGRVGQLGNGGDVGSSTPVRVAFPTGVTITAIGEAKNQGYAIDSAGHGWTWGEGKEHSSCLRDRVRFSPTEIPGLTEAVEVQGGAEHVLWRMRDGTVMGCGTNRQGQLGLGESVRKARSPTVIPGLEAIVQISSGNQTLAARDSSGRVFMSGENGNGQVGVGSSAANIWTPSQVPLGEPATYVSAGGDVMPNGTCFAMTAKTLYGWGFDGQGQVGDRETTPKFSPVNTGLHFQEVASGGAFVLGLDREGNVYAWGSNEGGSLGNGVKGGKSLRPKLVDSGVSAISATAQNALDIHP